MFLPFLPASTPVTFHINIIYNYHIVSEKPKCGNYQVKYKYQKCTFVGKKLSKIKMSNLFLASWSCPSSLIVQAAHVHPNSFLHTFNEKLSEYLRLKAIKSGLVRKFKSSCVNMKYNAPLNSWGESLWNSSDSCPLITLGRCLLYQKTPNGLKDSMQ